MSFPRLSCELMSENWISGTSAPQTSELVGDSLERSESTIGFLPADIKTQEDSVTEASPFSLDQMNGDQDWVGAFDFAVDAGPDSQGDKIHTTSFPPEPLLIECPLDSMPPTWDCRIRADGPMPESSEADLLTALGQDMSSAELDRMSLCALGDLGMNNFCLL